jgi:hypothetical protein
LACGFSAHHRLRPGQRQRLGAATPALVPIVGWAASPAVARPSEDRRHCAANGGSNHAAIIDGPSLKALKPIPARSFPCGVAISRQ